MKKLICFLLVVCVAAAMCSLTACAKKEKISNYNINANYNSEKGELSGTVDFSFYNNTGNELSELKFNLYGNAYREGAKYKPVSASYESRAYYDGASYGGMEIINVENCSGWEICGEDENILSVALAEPVYPEESCEVTITYTLALAKINHRTGITPDAVNLGNFYPVLCAYSTEGFVECPYYSCGDPFLSDVADYNVTIEAPEDFKIAASGAAESETKTNGRVKTQYVLRKARDFAVVLSNKFEVLTGEAEGVKVNYYYTSDQNPENSLKAVTESLTYFSQTFGKYVYPTLSVVETGFCYGGMEYPGLTMIASGQDETQNIYTIVHENAHQWWYAMVGSNQLTCGWQDEGLSEYSTLMFYEAHPDYGFTRAGIVGSATRSYRAFFSVYSQLNNQTDTSMNRNLGEYTSDFEYNNITYNKGLLLFDTLRTAVGDKNFTACLKNYYSENLYGIASPEKLIASFLPCGDVEGLFTSFIEGKILI